MTRSIAIVLLLTALQAAAAGQAPAPPAATPAPTSAGTAVDKFMIQMYPRLRGFLIDTVKLMPDDGFAARPGPDARTFAEAVMHLGVSNLSQCRAAAGRPLSQDELVAVKRTQPDKASLLKLMEDGFSACDPIFEKPDDERAAFTRGTLSVHSWEMYGTLAVYLRMKGIVPPSTQRAQKGRGQASSPR